MAELDADGRVVGFEEKPAEPKSDLIPIGVYFLRPDAFDVIDGLAPSGRGEFEITDVLNHYIPGGRPLHARSTTATGPTPGRCRRCSGPPSWRRRRRRRRPPRAAGRPGRSG